MTENTLTEEDFAFSSEQQEKIKNLRTKRTQEQFDKEEDKKLAEFNKKNRLKVGDPIYITKDGVTFIGFLKIIKEERYKSDVFTASTPHGDIEGLNWRNIQKRVIEPLQDVTIPDNLKAMSTKSLLRELRYARKLTYNSYDDWYRGNYQINQLKAVLATREHVPSKKENKVVKALQKTTNKRKNDYH